MSHLNTGVNVSLLLSIYSIGFLQHYCIKSYPLNCYSTELSLCSILEYLVAYVMLPVWRGLKNLVLEKFLLCILVIHLLKKDTFLLIFTPRSCLLAEILYSRKMFFLFNLCSLVQFLCFLFYNFPCLVCLLLLILLSPLHLLITHFLLPFYDNYPFSPPLIIILSEPIRSFRHVKLPI